MSSNGASDGDDRATQSASGRQSFNDLLATLRGQYTVALQGKLDAIAHDLLDEGDRTRTSAARVKAHNLRGSAGAFGFRELGKIAGELEECLILHARDGASWSAVLDLQGQLHAAVSRAVGAQPRLETRTDRSGALHGQAPNGRLFAVGCDESFVARLRASVRSELLEVSSCETEHSIELHPTGPLLMGAVIDARTDLDLAHAVRRIRESQRRPELPVAITFDEKNRARAVAAAELSNALLVVKDASEQELAEVVRAFRQDASLHGFRVLVVDDDPDFSIYMDVLLRNMGVDVRLLPNASTILDDIEEYNPDLVMLDVVLGDGSGLEVCRTLRRFVRWQRTPIVLITGRVDDDVRLAAYRAGASDFVSKPLIPEELRARVGVRLEHVRVLREYAEFDALTGLWNRRPFLNAAGRVFAQARRNHAPVALAILDIDRFKSVNDRYGHSIGDEVIAALGRMIRVRFRATDLRCRWGGEEMLMAFDGSDAASIAPAIADLLTEFSDLRFGNEEQGYFQCSFSAGIGSFPDAGDSFDAVLKHADSLLYRAKAAGRARVET